METKKRGRRGGKNIQNKKQKLENENQIDFTISSKELDGETRNYLIEIEKKLNEFYNENELQELEILIENVFDEINGKEEMISRDFEASRILEKMITNCSDSKLMEFGIRMKPIFKDLITDQFGSHVVQTWLNKSSSVMEKEFTVGSDGSMQDIIVEFAELLTGEWQNYMVHKYASFVARTFLNVLSGDSLANESEIRSKKSQSFNENRKQIEKKKNRIVPIQFKELLQQIAEKVASSIDYDNLIKLITNPVGNPVLQMLVSIPTSKCLIDAILKDSTLVHNIIKDRVGSHLIEKILANCNEKQYKQIYKVCFKNDIQEISRHFISNFVIQKLIESCKSEKIFIQIFDGLVNLFDEFIFARENRRGLVVQLVNGCVHYKSCQERMIQSIYKAFGIQDNDPGAMDTVSLCVLSIYSHNRLKEEGFIAKPNIQGSLILSSLLKFDSKYSNAFANSLLSLGLETLQSFVSDPIRSRILDAFIQSDTIQNKKKRELINLFKGMYVVLAVDKYGSRFFEKLWDQANLEMKDEILAELIKSKMKLQQSFVGKYIVRNTALELFEKRKDEWLNYQKGLNKAKKKDKKGDEIDQLFLAKGK